MIVLLLACADPIYPSPPGVMTVLQEQQATWARNFNPLLSTGGARWPTTAGIYEPMLVFNRATGEFVPWLATDWHWEQPALSLRFQVREGVLWSDGQPFSAEDIVYTFELLRRVPALDGAGLWSFVAAVSEPDPQTVQIDFKKPYSPGLALVAHQDIIPKHIWENIPDPVSFANPNPVATGPFTEILRFDPQIWELGRNPHYWQGLPKVVALRFPAIASNDQALLALIQGEIDWAGSFVPAIERTYVARDPEHFSYWFPAVSDTVFLYPQTTLPSLQDVRVRQALSLALDREVLVKVAMQDYAHPAHATALSDGYQRWRREDLLPQEQWVRHDPPAAAQLLEAAGWTLSADGQRRDPQGHLLELPIICPAGWSDWVRAAQIISQDLAQLGIVAPVQGLDFATWFDRLGRGDFALSLGWSVSGPSPYPFYRALMGSGTLKAVGTPASANWHRYSSPAADRLLAAFEATSDPAEQFQIAAQLQTQFIEEAPAIPLFPSPNWGEYNTRRFRGFPHADDPYAILSPNAVPDILLVLTHLSPQEAP